MSCLLARCVSPSRCERACAPAESSRCMVRAAVRHACEMLSMHRTNRIRRTRTQRAFHTARSSSLTNGHSSACSFSSPKTCVPGCGSDGKSASRRQREAYAPSSRSAIAQSRANPWAASACTAKTLSRPVVSPHLAAAAGMAADAEDGADGASMGGDGGGDGAVDGDDGDGGGDDGGDDCGGDDGGDAEGGDGGGDDNPPANSAAASA
mmetsp:Transcript_34375/g.77963  ORF Transcript_34375/g.77963 Transcript_34375/m.77963 type:complete len:208 (+) Transcript_34375:510-1133(+)